jgi:hypothetical protein
VTPSPGTGWRIAPVRPIRSEYKPVLSRVERMAYAAAHRIMQEQTQTVELACAGARRSAQADAIAKIIIESLQGR